MNRLFQKMFSGFTGQKTERKNFYAFPSGSSYSYGLMNPTKALYYYTQVAPLFTSVNMISTEAAALDNVLINTRTDEIITDAPVLQLLSNPNADCTGDEFMSQLVSFYKLTGNVFIVATGNPSKPALELQVINPTLVTMTAGIDGYPETVSVQLGNQQVTTFKRFENKGKFRFLSENAEIWHIKSFSPRYGAGDLFGMSDLTAITVELDQYYEASVHNLSTLQRGARPSGAIKTQGFLSDDQYMRLQEQAHQFYSGSQNAGRVMILDNSDFVQMSLSNKDMDFATLKKSVTDAIYNSFRIPLPLINAEFSSYNNLEVSKINFYDNVIFPLAKRIYEELTNFLMPRYDKTGQQIIFYDEAELDALTPRKNAERASIIELVKVGILSPEEARTELGFDSNKTVIPA